MIISIICSILIISTLCGCAGGSIYDNQKWKDPNELYMMISYSYIDREDYEDPLEKETVYVGKASKEVYEILKEEKEDIAGFFKEEYNVDVRKKLDKLRDIYIYSQEKSIAGHLAGYVDSDNCTVNLDEDTVKNELELRTVLYHEIMHYLGVISRNDIMHYWIEGFAEALGEAVAKHSGKKYILTELYALQTSLAKQIIEVDSEIVRKFLTESDFEVSDYINGKLKDVPQRFNNVEDIASYWETSIKCWYYGLDDEGNARLQAQLITFAYCKEFNPSDAQIENIRKNYVVPDFEMYRVAQ